MLQALTSLDHHLLLAYLPTYYLALPNSHCHTGPFDSSARQASCHVSCQCGQEKKRQALAPSLPFPSLDPLHWGHPPFSSKGSGLRDVLHADRLGGRGGQSLLFVELWLLSFQASQVLSYLRTILLLSTTM